jgi:uncharacterized membrane protein
MKNLGSREFLLKILGLQLVFCAIVFFNIPVARQVIGFVYLTFVPGVIIARLLKLGISSGSRRILFSAGFGIAFLMFTGLLINMVGPAIGISQPLSLIPVVVTLSLVVLLLAFISCFRKDVKYLPTSIDRKSVLSVAFPLCLPVIAIVGALLMNFSGNNSILLLLMAAISVFFSVSVLWKKLTFPKIYALMVLAIALALLFHAVLVSNYVTFADIQIEYYVFNSTVRHKFWSSALPQFWDATYGRFNSMLSITVLPTIYFSVLDIDPTWILKIVYPLVFSLVPLGLFSMWKPHVGLKRAFFSAFVFMAQLTFYNEMLGLCRQMIGELFLVLLFMVLVSGKIGRFNRNLCFIVFGAALVVSHYSLSYLFMLFIAFAWALFYVLKRSCRINLTMVIVFFVMAFSWYIYTSSAGSFQSFLSFGDSVASSMGEFANFGARSQGVLKGIGLASSPTILNTVSRIIAYMIEVFIVLGFFSVVTKRTNIRLNNEYVAFSWVCVGLLAATVLLPGFAQTLNVERFYHISLFFLAPFCVIGAEVLIGVLTYFSSYRKFKPRQKLDREMRWKPTILLLAILLLYFLFQTNFLYEISGSESWSIPLSKQRLDPIQLYESYAYIDESDVFGARWLVKSIDLKHTTLFADAGSISGVLTSYGMIYRGDVEGLSNTTKVSANGTVYMSRMNVVDGLMIQGHTLGGAISNTSVIFPMLDITNQVYTNGACEIYEKNG